MHIPRIVISGLSGGSGKTMVSLGLARAFARRGLAVRAFKKGPDYIDAAWLALAARCPQRNLDPFFSDGPALRALFLNSAANCDLAVIEGNRGLFDGLDLEGSCSTAALARQLAAPVLLVVDCTKMTRTAAALVAGCARFDPGVAVGGAILNRTGNARHQDLVRRAVEELAGIPVPGVLPRRASPFIAERHMGLAGTADLADADARLDQLADFIAEHVDLDAVLRLAESAPSLPPARPESPEGRKAGGIRIGVVRDAAFWFYYGENLAALEEAGAELAQVSLLDGAPWPELDGLYIGGGLPELHAAALAANAPRRAEVLRLSRGGLPVYAECGGFMYLAEELIIDGTAYPMAGVFPCAVEMLPRPQGLGYAEAEVTAPNPFHPVGARFRGHEFHFSRCLPKDAAFAPGVEGVPGTPVLRLTRGRGMQTIPGRQGLDGLCRDNTYAGYMHTYAPALPHWAPAFTALCRNFRRQRQGAWGPAF